MQFWLSRERECSEETFHSFQSFDVALKSLNASATQAEGIKIVQPGNSFNFIIAFISVKYFFLREKSPTEEEE